jgi:hypothetical protein
MSSKPTTDEVVGHAQARVGAARMAPSAIMSEAAKIAGRRLVEREQRGHAGAGRSA